MLEMWIQSFLLVVSIRLACKIGPMSVTNVDSTLAMLGRSYRLAINADALQPALSWQSGFGSQRWLHANPTIKPYMDR